MKQWFMEDNKCRKMTQDRVWEFWVWFGLALGPILQCSGSTSHLVLMCRPCGARDWIWSFHVQSMHFSQSFEPTPLELCLNLEKFRFNCSMGFLRVLKSEYMKLWEFLKFLNWKLEISCCSVLLMCEDMG